ncbi:MAG: hypothetical protein U5L45_26610 [Saprospiraceae bacterium]|nr:hypothetical protein [Saprospiraceae bacterium]
MDKQIVTITIFRFDGFNNRFWAFGQMGRRPFQKGVAEGLTFGKMLGTGGDKGFSIFPNWGVYAWLGAWDTEGSARTFFNQNALFQSFQQRTTEHFTVYLQPTMAHGRWDGEEPFKVSTPFDPNAPVAVLTRATIKPRFLYRFWQYVPNTSRSIESAEGRLFSIGVGELPLIQQATFSLWTSGKAMMDYAYKSRYHAEVVKKTRELGWYSEELFARFQVTDKENFKFS